MEFYYKELSICLFTLDELGYTQTASKPSL